MMGALECTCQPGPGLRGACLLKASQFRALSDPNQHTTHTCWLTRIGSRLLAADQERAPGGGGQDCVGVDPPRTPHVWATQQAWAQHAGAVVTNPAAGAALHDALCAPASDHWQQQRLQLAPCEGHWQEVGRQGRVHWDVRPLARSPTGTQLQSTLPNAHYTVSAQPQPALSVVAPLGISSPGAPAHPPTRCCCFTAFCRRRLGRQDTPVLAA